MAYSEAYKDALCLLCRQSALFEHYKNAKKAGRLLASERELKRNLELAAWAKAEFLREKEKLGLPGGIDFMSETLSFSGFSYRGGELTGDTSKLTRILEPWMRLEENEQNCWKYEVAVLLLSHYYMGEGKYRHAEPKVLIMDRIWIAGACLKFVACRAAGRVKSFLTRMKEIRRADRKED